MNNTNTESDTYPLYASAVLLPVLAFPSWFLCIPPLMCHYSQRNIAGWSLMLWIILMNFCNFINPLIWPRDNIPEWWDGNVLCDIEVRIQVGCGVAYATCTAMIMRKLAKVMDTSNITIAPSRSSIIRVKALEVLWCWGFPLLVILVYYVVQPVRYYIFGISGCMAAFNLSWVTIVLTSMWEPIIVIFASYYAGLLLYRLYRYRKEFHRLIAARHTTTSRFIRLFAFSTILIIILVPYSFWLLYMNAANISEQFVWDEVHGPDWNTVLKMPSHGVVRFDKWGQLATGYSALLIFGTGSDANNTYKRMLCAFGLDEIFPRLRERSKTGSSTPRSFLVARGWCSSCASKARTLFSKNDSIAETTLPSRNNSIVDGTSPADLHAVSTNDPMLPKQSAQPSHKKTSLLGRLVTRRNPPQDILPLFARKSVQSSQRTEKSPTSDTSSPRGVFSHAWASDNPIATRDGERGVHVMQEVYQEDHISRKQSR